MRTTKAWNILSYYIDVLLHIKLVEIRQKDSGAKRFLLAKDETI